MSKNKAKQAASHIDPGSPRHSRMVEESSKKQQLQPFDPYRGAIAELLDQLSKTRDSLTQVTALYEDHKKEIVEANSWKNKCQKLQDSHRETDDELTKLNNTIEVLKKQNTAEEHKLAVEKVELQVERNNLETEKSVLEQETKRLEAKYVQLLAEEKKRIKREQDHILRQKAEEKEKQYAENSAIQHEKLKKSQADMQAVLVELDREKQRYKDQCTELARLEEELDSAKRAKKSTSDEMREVKQELNTFYNDFCPVSRDIKFYKDKFLEIQARIKVISNTQLKDLRSSAEEFDQIHKRLCEVDPIFKSVPISESETSRKICRAHAQRVITSTLVSYIWKRYSSETTFTYPDRGGFIEEIERVIVSKARPGSRAAASWYTSTIRAIQKLSYTALPSEESQLKKLSRQTKVVESIYNTLAPLIHATEEQKFKEAVGDLAGHAISIWELAQTDEMEIIVDDNLDSKFYDTCRSMELDPPLTSGNENDKLADKTCDSIFTLFPRIIARVTNYTNLQSVNMPGSFPTPERGPEPIDNCVHPGLGLSASAPLLLEGEREARDYNELMKTTINEAKREARKRAQSQTQS